MIFLHPDAESTKVLTFDEFRNQLIAAYAKHKENEKIKQERCRIGEEDVNFTVSYWFTQLPSLFQKSLDAGAPTIQISYSSYPRYYDEPKEFLDNLFRKAYPRFKKILDNMGIIITSANLESDYPSLNIKIEEFKKFVNSNYDVISDIDEEEGLK